ncbi:Predicted metal-binding membrane protein [Trinickia caryophylli]|uniref:Predicted metal-binding membrane protein n=2 Tax=Trinickia caryophylli TaxID=28094 RepID=A0A1X7FJK6_TRICW|nr:Predicted metal-binding membrane protein [Trinickia caryophylli]
MAAMGAVPMPGGWSISAAWVPLCGESWHQLAASFVGMWTVMMAVMMLPSLAPMLWCYLGAANRTDAARPETSVACLLAGYFLVWAAAGALVFAAGAAFFQMAMAVPALARACPIVAGTTVLWAGAMQFTAWKTHHLACLRGMRRRAGPRTRNGRMARRAWTGGCEGMRLAFHCMFCGAGLTAVLLVTGAMDLRAMAFVTGATTIERLAPAGKEAPRAIGAALLAFGAVMLTVALAS